MSNLTYKLSRDKVCIKQLTENGEFCRKNKTRYTISIPKDLNRPLTQFELVCFQPNKRVLKKDAHNDENRHLLISKPKAVNTQKPFYLATMCVIGAMVSLNPKHEAIDVSKIVKAVSERDEHWQSAISSFNGLFETDSDTYYRGSSRSANGKMIAACALTGLQVVCDLIKESRNLVMAGKHLDAVDIDNMLESMGLLNLNAYLLLSSPDHPEQAALSDALDKYENKYELCVDNAGNWILVSGREIKKVVFIDNATSNNTLSSEDDYIVVASNNDDDNVLLEHGEAGSITQHQDEPFNQVEAEPPVTERTIQYEHESQTDNGDMERYQDEPFSDAEHTDVAISHVNEPSYNEPEPASEDVVQQQEVAKPQVEQSEYSTKRTRRLPPGASDGEAKLDESDDKSKLGGFQQRQPSGTNEVVFDIGDL